MAKFPAAPNALTTLPFQDNDVLCQVLVGQFISNDKPLKINKACSLKSTIYKFRVNKFSVKFYNIYYVVNIYLLKSVKSYFKIVSWINKLLDCVCLGSVIVRLKKLLLSYIFREAVCIDDYTS